MPEIPKSNFQGLPLDVYTILPEEIKSTLPDTIYTPEFTWELVLKYFEGKLIEPFAQAVAEGWETDFNSRIEKSYNRQEFIQREIKKYSYNDFFNDASIVDVTKTIERLGYDMAVESKDAEIGIMLSNNLIRGYYYETPDFNSYTSLISHLKNIQDLIRGFAMPIFLNKIKTELSSKYLTNSMEQEIEVNVGGNKLRWIGTPSQFGFIIQELIGKGYLEKPTSSNAKNAKLFLSIFDIDTTEQTLSKELSDKTNSISPENARLLTIAHINKLNNNNQKVAGK